jgi:hypothetical protein
VRWDAVATTRRAESVLAVGRYVETRNFATEVAKGMEMEERKWRNNSI